MHGVLGPFAESQTVALGKGTVCREPDLALGKGTICREPNSSSRQRDHFAESQAEALGEGLLCRAPSFCSRQSNYVF
jgi:hypothetical protein